MLLPGEPSLCKAVRGLVHSFQRMVRWREADALPEWVEVDSEVYDHAVSRMFDYRGIMDSWDDDLRANAEKCLTT